MCVTVAILNRHHSEARVLCLLLSVLVLGQVYQFLSDGCLEMSEEKRVNKGHRDLKREERLIKNYRLYFVLL